ncbi:unnamed protein product [Paramecium sonneborni]|uniref:Uncharacterized protein n=1 Tax=Paramecium sonneborni TaxID=65129 RepID=A0A8S1LJ55_9CILI|nr:unnamed protein product [Paramecium sonneborni]
MSILKSNNYQNKKQQGFSLNDELGKLLSHQIMIQTNESNSFLDFSQIEQESEPRTSKKVRKNPKENEDDSWDEDFKYIYQFRTSFKTRGKQVQLREYYLEQIENDQIFWKCVPHPKLLEFLETHNYNDIYEYVKYCNKQGLLLEYPIKKYYQEQIEIPKYNYYQMKEIHEKNYIQRSIESLVDEVKKLKITKGSDFPKTNNGNLVKFYTPEEIQQEYRRQEQIKNKQRELGRQIKERKLQNDNKAQELKPIYEEFPLDQPINEDTIKACILEFIKINFSIVEQFQPQQKMKDVIQEDEIDYDFLSDDSLKDICSTHPRERKNFYSLNFANRVQAIQVVNFFRFQKDEAIV